MIATTIEQSKRLLAAGVKRETADMWWHPDWDEKYPDCYRRCRVENIPAWSLSALWDLVAKQFRGSWLLSDSSDQLIEDLVKFLEETYIG